MEHLLLALEDAPGAAVDVRLSFTPDALELHVSGPPAADVDLRAVLAAARERAGLHGGTVDSRLAGGVCHAMARLPLVSGHAWFRRFALSWRSDLLLAAIVAGWVLVYLGLIARTGDQHWMVLVFALP